MPDAPSPDLCPFCAQVQPPDPADHWRCPSCNLYVRAQDLVTGEDEVALEALSQDFCPWCAFPVAREHSLPDDGEFVCPGCNGCLTVGMLETQASINAWRHRQLSGLGYLVFALVLIAIVFVTLAMIT